MPIAWRSAGFGLFGTGSSYSPHRSVGMAFKSMAEARAANKAAGQFWFSPDTMEFFSSRVETGLIRGRFFVSSEVPPALGQRRYTVREARDDGTVTTVGIECGYSTKVAARQAITERLA